MPRNTTATPKATYRELKTALVATQDMRKSFLYIATKYPKEARRITPEYFNTPDDFLRYCDQIIEDLETRILIRQP